MLKSLSMTLAGVSNCGLLPPGLLTAETVTGKLSFTNKNSISWMLLAVELSRSFLGEKRT